MSKIVDLLTYKKRAPEKKGYEEILSSKILSQSFDKDTKEHLANTYILPPFGKSSNTKKEPKENSAISPYKASHAGTRPLHLFPWLISLLAVLLLLVNIAYRGKINIKIEFLNNESTQAVSEAAGDAAAKESSALLRQPVEIPNASNFLISNGEIDNNVIKKVGFYGAALKNSRILKDGLYLINDGTTGWASAGFDLTEPMDLANSTLDFFVKGANGNESLRIILRDAENNSYLPQAQNLIFNKTMGMEWQFVSIPLNNFTGYYNAREINHIGFEFGTQTTLNEPGSSIYIKNIKIVKK